MKEVKRRSEYIGKIFNLGEEWTKKEEEFFRIGPVYIELHIPSKLRLNRIEVLYMSGEELEEYFEKLRIFLLNEYEKENVPISGQKINLNTLQQEFWKLIKLDVFDPKVFYEEDGKKFLKGYYRYGLQINGWFPEMQDVKIAGQYSIIDQLRDKELFYKKAHRIIIKNSLKVYKRRDEMIFPKFGATFRVVSGAQPVTNIRPSVAKWIWLNSALNNCKDQDEIIVWDPSMGWAGRLISFLSAMKHPDLSDKKKFIYIGTDPNKEIFDRYEKIITFWKQSIDIPIQEKIDEKHVRKMYGFLKKKINLHLFENPYALFGDPKCYPRLGSKSEVHPLCRGSEDFNKTDLFKKFCGRGSIVYTSPPYFAKEQYSQDEGQSFKKFSGYQGWKEGFLKPTIENAYEFLAEGKLFYWNIADVKIGKDRLPLEQDSIEIAKEAGFTLKEKLYQLMKTFPGRDSSNQAIKKQIVNGANFIKTEGKWVKYEPVFVFQK